MQVLRSTNTRQVTQAENTVTLHLTPEEFKFLTDMVGLGSISVRYDKDENDPIRRQKMLELADALGDYDLETGE